MRKMKKRTNRPISVQRMKKQCSNWRCINKHLDTNIWRPQKRSECPTTRPCPYVTCRYHMYLDYTDKGEIYRYHDKNKRLDNVECTCFFDLQKNKLVYTLQEIANIFGVTKERVRQIQAEALKKLSSRPESRKHNEM